jgi:putative spermidine/putrescine transport system permease protein
VSGRRRLSLAWVATLPFFAYTIAFLFLPAASVLVGAFQDKHDHATFSNVRLLFQHPYIDAYWGSLRISLVTALLGCVIGLFVAYAAIRDGTPRWIRSVLTTFSGVAANFGGQESCDEEGCAQEGCGEGNEKDCRQEGARQEEVV